MNAHGSSPAPNRVHKFLLRPAVLIWALLALGMMGLIAGDLLAPGLVAPLGRFMAHRDNLESPEWKAALAAEPHIGAGSVVVVETDNRVFFFTLRYRIYPTPVLLAGESDQFVDRFDGSSIVRVHFKEGDLRIEENHAP